MKTTNLLLFAIFCMLSVIASFLEEQSKHDAYEKWATRIAGISVGLAFVFAIFNKKDK